MKVLLIDTDNLQPQVIETTGGLKEWLRLIKCDTIDITSLNIGGRYYDVIVDDEGLLKDGIKPTALDTEYKPLLVGSLVICNADGEGNETALTDEDVEYILKYIVMLRETGTDHPQEWLALKNVSY